MRKYRAWLAADLPAALATLREELQRHRRTVLAIGVPVVIAAVTFAVASIPFAHAASDPPESPPKPSCAGSTVAKSTDGGAAVTFNTSNNKLTACDIKKDGRSAVGEWGTSSTGSFQVVEVNDDGVGTADESDNAIKATLGQTIFIRACSQDLSAGEKTPSACGTPVQVAITTTTSGSSSTGSSSTGSTTSDTDTNPSAATSTGGGAKATFTPTTGLLQICSTQSSTTTDAVVIWFTAAGGLKSAHATGTATGTASGSSTASATAGNCTTANADAPLANGTVIVYFACTQAATAHSDLKNCVGIKDTSALKASSATQPDLTSDLSNSSSG